MAMIASPGRGASAKRIQSGVPFGALPDESLMRSIDREPPTFTPTPGIFSDIAQEIRGTAYDSAVQDFLAVLEEHRKNSEKLGKYAEADIARQRCVEVKVHELNRKKEAMRSRQLSELLDCEVQHIEQLHQFNAEWDERFIAFEASATKQLEDLQNRHGEELRSFQQRMLVKTNVPRHSSEYFNLRRIEEHLARNKSYEAAATMKEKADELGAWEEERWQAERQADFLRVENNFKQKLAQELDTLRKKIATQRAEQSRNRQTALEMMLMRYGNVKHEVLRKHTSERQQFDKELQIQMRLLRVEAGKS